MYNKTEKCPVELETRLPLKYYEYSGVLEWSLSACLLQYLYKTYIYWKNACPF